MLQKCTTTYAFDTQIIACTRFYDPAASSRTSPRASTSSGISCHPRPSSDHPSDISGPCQATDRDQSRHVLPLFACSTFALRTFGGSVQRTNSDPTLELPSSDSASGDINQRLLLYQSKYEGARVSTATQHGLLIANRHCVGRHRGRICILHQW